jgi:hypothetical protein
MCISIAYMIFRKKDDKKNEDEPNVRQVTASQPPVNPTSSAPGEKPSANGGGVGGAGQEGSS